MSPHQAFQGGSSVWYRLGWLNGRFIKSSVLGQNQRRWLDNILQQDKYQCSWVLARILKVELTRTKPTGWHISLVSNAGSSPKRIIDGKLFRSKLTSLMLYQMELVVAGSAQSLLVSSVEFLAASLSFSSLISLNFFMFSKNSGLLCKVMKSFAFLLSPLDPYTVMVLVLISLNVA